MFNGMLKSDDVEVYENSGDTNNRFFLSDTCKSNIIIAFRNTPSCSMVLPTTAYIGKVINFTVLSAGSLPTGKGDFTTSLTIQHSNTTIFTLKQGTVSFMYVGQQLNGLTATDKAKSGWIILGGVQGDTAITGYAGSVAIGSGAYCGSNDVVAIGKNATAGNTGAVGIGGAGTNSPNGINSVCIGGINNVATGENSVGFCSYSSTNSVVSRFAIGASPRTGTAGANQSSVLNVGVQTTTDTANIALKSNTTSISSSNQFALINNSTIGFTIYVVGNVAAASSVMYKIEGLIRRGANASTVTLVGTPTITQLFSDTALSTTSVSVIADTTYGALQVRATGVLATTINWNATINTSEVI